MEKKMKWNPTDSMYVIFGCFLEVQRDYSCKKGWGWLQSHPFGYHDILEEWKWSRLWNRIQLLALPAVWVEE